MKRRFYWLVLLVILVAGCQERERDAEVTNPISTVHPTGTRVVPPMIDFSVGGVRLGDTEAEVLKHLGEPRKRTLSNEDMCGISPILKLRYAGIEFWLDRGSEEKRSEWSVLEIRVDSSDIVVEPGTRIGDSPDSIRQRLGSPWTERESEGTSRYYYLTKDNDNAQLEFKGGSVRSIRLYINPC